MITKAIITNIDYNTNKCTVRIPLFETVSNIDPITAPATICTLPGAFNGYSVDDVVYVGFDENKLDYPVVIGKLYTTSDAEAASGAINCKTLIVKDSVNIPENAQIATSIPGHEAIKTLSDIIQRVITDKNFNQIDYLTTVKVKYKENNFIFILKTKNAYGTPKNTDIAKSNILELESNIIDYKNSVNTTNYFGIPMLSFTWTTQFKAIPGELTAVTAFKTVDVDPETKTFTFYGNLSTEKLTIPESSIEFISSAINTL